MDVNRWPRMLGPIVFACAVLVPADALAQTSLQIPLQFDFLNPGAKSLALGGAFVGLADDATATFANPAGLTQLGASELSIEGRGSRIATQFLQIGRLSGPLSNQGTDTIQGAVFGDSVGSQGGVAFLAGVYSHPSRRWVIAGYRHELARVDQAFSSNGVFQKEPSQLGSQRDLPQDGHRQVDITGYGISGSVQGRPHSRDRREPHRLHVRHDVRVPPLQYGRVFRPRQPGFGRRHGDAERRRDALGSDAWPDGRPRCAEVRRGLSTRRDLRYQRRATATRPSRRESFACQTLWPSGRRSGADRLCSPLWK